LTVSGTAERFPLARVLAVAAILAAWRWPGALLDERRTTCLFRRVTGLPCPTCGMTRSWNAALGLRFRESASHHPFGLPVLGAAIVLASGRWQPKAVEPLPPRALAIFAVAWTATWLRRVSVARRRAT
jgi:hypothetical protein